MFTDLFSQKSVDCAHEKKGCVLLAGSSVGLSLEKKLFGGCELKVDRHLQLKLASRLIMKS